MKLNICVSILIVMLSCGRVYLKFDSKDLHEAVLELFDPLATQEENEYNIMRYFCPESVYCECQGQPRNNTCQRINDIKFETYPGKSKNNLTAYVNELDGCCARCFCDEGCYEKGNCCRKKSGRSSAISENKTSTKCVSATSETHAQFINSAVLAMADAYFMVTTCMIDATSEVVSKCLSPREEVLDQVVPVSSRTTGSIYQNIYCARCNNDTNTVTWNVLIKHSRAVPLTDTYFPMLYDDILNSRLSMIFFKPAGDAPVEQNQMCVLKEKSQHGNCSPHPPLWFNHIEYFEFLHQACYTEITEHIYSSFYFRNTLFKNVFCFLCTSIIKVYGDKNPRCDFASGKQMTGLLFLLNGMNENKMTENNNNLEIRNETCECYEWQDIKANKCRTLLCPWGKVRDGCECRDWVKYISGLTLDIRFQIEPEEPNILQVLDVSAGTPTSNYTHLVDKIIKKVPSLVVSKMSQSIILNIMAMFIIQKNLTPVFYAVAHIQAKPEYDTRIIVKDILEIFWKYQTFVVNNRLFKIRLGPIYDLNIKTGGIYTFMNPAMFDIVISVFNRQSLSSNHNAPEPFRKLIICEKLALYQEEKKHLNYSASHNQEFVRNLKYIYSESSSEMCFDDFLVLFVPKSSSEKCSYMAIEIYIWILVILNSCLSFI